MLQIGQIKKDQTAWLISVVGLLPLLTMAAALALTGATSPLHQYLVDGFRIYSAIVLAFLGGVRYGMSVSAGKAGRDLLFAVLPLLAAWIAMFMPPAPSIAIMLLAFSALGAWDSLSFHSKTELSGYVRLRIAMTLAVATILFASLLFVA